FHHLPAPVAISAAWLSSGERQAPEMPGERPVDQQDVDARLSEHEQVAPFDIGLDDRPHARLVYGARPGGARCWPERRRRGKIAPATAVVTRGYASPTPIKVTSVARTAASSWVRSMSAQTRPTAARPRSMILMPMNGAITPPTP